MASPGGQVPIELVIKNLGFGDAGVFRAAFYLSVDNAVDTTDTYTGWTCNFDTGLKAGSTSTCAGSIGIPSNVALGTYLLGVIADNRVELAETSRLNNTRTADSGHLGQHPGGICKSRDHLWRPTLRHRCFQPDSEWRNRE
jgi:hypothetical protein